MFYHLEELFRFHWKWDVGAELGGTNKYPDIDCISVRGKVKYLKSKAQKEMATITTLNIMPCAHN